MTDPRIMFALVILSSELFLINVSATQCGFIYIPESYIAGYNRDDTQNSATEDQCLTDCAKASNCLSVEYSESVGLFPCWHNTESHLTKDLSVGSYNYYGKIDKSCVGTTAIVINCSESCGTSLRMNNGACVVEGSSYTCSCTAGFTGMSCEQDIDIDECISDPCLNAGTCVDQANGYVCDCSSTGATGTYCEQSSRKKYKSSSGNDQVIRGGHVISESTRQVSRVKCASLCLEEMACIGYNYNSITGHCEILDTNYQLQPSLLEGATGYKHYWDNLYLDP